MQYHVKECVDHTEQHNCKKPDHGHEIPYIDYEINVSCCDEAQKNEILEVVKKVFQAHLDKETASNLKRLNTD